MRIFFFGLLLFFFNMLSWAQLSVSDRFTVLKDIDGLTSNTVYAITQSENGLLWLATENGLISFDGQQFETFTPDNSNMSHIRVFDLTNDISGNIWAATGNGLCRVNPFSLTIEKYYSGKGSSNNLITNIKADKYGNIWFSHSNSLYRVVVSMDSVSMHMAYSSDVGHIHKIELDENDNVWISTGNRLIKYITTEKRSETVFDFPIQTQGDNNEIFNNLKAQDTILWCTTNFGKLYKISILNKSITAVDFLKNESRIIINNITIENGHLNLSLDKKGIYLYNIQTAEGYFLKNSLFSVVDNKSIRCIYKDSGNNIWLSINKVGIAYATPNSAFVLKNNQTSGYAEMASNIVSSVSVLGTTTLIGTDGGGLYSDHKGKLQKFAIEANEILSINQIGEQVWVGTYTDGVYALNTNETKKVVKHLHKRNSPLLSNDIRTTIIDSAGIYWFITHGNGIQSFNPTMQKYTAYSTLNGLAGDWTYSIVCDKNNTKWVGTNNGLCSISENGTIVTYDTKEHPLLPDDFIFSLYIDNEQLWCGTVGGFGIFDLNARCFVPTKDKIAESCHSIIGDDSGNIWIGTDNGLLKLSQSGAILREFKGKYPLPAKSFSKNCVRKDANGNLHWGTINGLLSFHPDSLREEYFAPILSLKEMKISNHDYSFHTGINEPAMKSHYQLGAMPYTNNSLEFVFNVVDFSNPLLNTLSYSLNGFDTTYFYDKNTNRIRYNALSPGTYSLRVTAIANENSIHSNSINIAFEITPPFWNTWWFRTIFIVTVISAIYIFITLRTKRILRQKAMLTHKVTIKTKELSETLQALEHEKTIVELQNKQLVDTADKLQEQNISLDTANKTKMRFMSIIAHDIKNPFSVLLNGSTMLEMNFDNYSQEKKKTFITMLRKSSETIFSHLTNMLDWARGQSEGIVPMPSHLDLLQVSTEVSGLLLNLFTNKQLVFKNNINEGTIVYADKDMLSAILRNLLNNAIKYTPTGGEITIDVQIAIDNCEVSVSDTGIGISKEDIDKILDPNIDYSTYGTNNELGTGLGISICKQFAELNGGTLTIQSVKDRGSVFAFTLPCGSAEKISNVSSSEKIDFPIVNMETEIDIKPMKSKTVIIVEDNKNIRDHLQHELERYFTVNCAADGKKGWELIEQIQPDIVLSDVEMPGMNGFELCGKIKSSLHTSHIPVLLITARNGDSDKLVGLGLGANDYILKPYKPNELLLKIKNSLLTVENQQKRFSIEEKDYSEYSSYDETVLTKFMNILETEFNDSNLKIEEIGSKVGMSRSHLYKKIIALTGKSPNDILQEIRMNNAISLLKNTELSISEVAYKVGYNDPRYFSNRFKIFIGKTPSELRSKG